MHSTFDCFKLKNRAKHKDSSTCDGKAHAKPFSKRTFHKEANALAHKAVKAKALDVYTVALKKAQGKQKKKTAKKASASRMANSLDSEGSKLDKLMMNIKSPIPRKKNRQKRRASLPTY